jgi:ADP-ribose pyrophosphatase
MPDTLPSVPGVEILSEQIAWSGRFRLKLIRFRHRRFDGRMSEPKTWELWCRGAAVGLLPYDPHADALVLIEQFRLPALAAGVDPVMVEIPAGLCDPGEDPAATLLREAQEEIGLVPSRLEHIGDFVLSPGGIDERIGIHVGQVRAPEAGPDGLVGTAGVASEGEDIRIRVWPAERAITKALAGRMPNSVTTIALLWLAANRERLRREWKDTQ